MYDERVVHGAKLIYGILPETLKTLLKLPTNGSSGCVVDLEARGHFDVDLRLDFQH